MLKAIRLFKERKPLKLFSIKEGQDLVPFKPNMPHVTKEDQGVKTFWPKFMLSAIECFSKKESTPEQDNKTSPATDAVSADEEIINLVIENPDMGAGGLLKAIKDKGLSVVDNTAAASMPDKEADSASSMPATLRKKESALVNIRCQLKESISKDDPSGIKYKVVLIQEGLGNLKDCYYYTRKALESAIPLFEGKKIYADHPSSLDEQIRPERSVRDILGHYETLRLEESKDGCAMLVADLITIKDQAYQWARSVINHAIDYSKKYPTGDFVGLSINASGDAEPMEMSEFIKETDIPKSAFLKLQQAIAEGITQVKVVNALTSAVSCDLVTEAGAKGRILNMLETETKMADEKKKEDEAKQKMKQAEDEAKQKKEDEQEDDLPTKDDSKGDDKGDDDGHDDAGKDKELISKMLKKHLGDTADDAEVMKHAHEAYEAYKEMGYEDAEAMKCAGHAIKLAKHMASKTVPEEQTPGKADAMPGKEAEKHEDEKKESASLLKAKGEILRLKESLKKYELTEILDKKLAALKESRKVTDLIRNSIKSLKSEAQIDEAISLIMEGYKMRTEDVLQSFGEPMMTEKNTAIESETVKGFGDCKSK